MDADTAKKMLDAMTGVPQPLPDRVRDLAAATASQAAAVELTAYALATEAFGDQNLHNLVTTLAGASHRLSTIAEQVALRLTPTTQEDTTDDKPDPDRHPYLGPSHFGGF